MPVSKTLRIAVMAPATVHWSRDGWQTAKDVSARNTGLEIYVADLPPSQLDAGHSIVFTMYWPEADRWEGADFEVTIQSN